MPSETWTNETVGGHPCDIFIPEEPNPHGYVLLYLHGVHEQRMVDNAVFQTLFQRNGLPVVAPLTRQSWWVDRICDQFDTEITAEAHVLDNVLPMIAERWGSQPPQIALWGTSMGGQGALRLSYKHPDIFPVVAGISPAIDFQQRVKEGDENLLQMYGDPESARQDTATLHIHPLNWPRHQFFCCDPRDERWFESADRLRMKLGSLGVPFECDLATSRGGHGIEYYEHMAEVTIEFLIKRLDQERLRVA